MVDASGPNQEKKAVLFTLPLVKIKIAKMNGVHILLVEDNEGDIFLITEALEERKIVKRITVVRNGKDAIDLLEKNDLTDEMPDLVLLDINLPKRNGHEVLAHIKTSTQLKHIPVIMLTTSSSEKDIKTSYQNHANCFITKPIQVDNLLTVIAAIENFWINIVTFQNFKPSLNEK
jgi:CheY-like chemotaxis protein